MTTATLKKDGATLVEVVELALRLGERMKGLLGRTSLGAGRAMYIAPCASIHTFLMKFSLDLVFLDRSMKVCRIVRNVRPNRVVGGGWGARAVLEMETGWFPEGALKEGDKVELS